MSVPVEFFYDYASPFSYLASARLRAELASAEIRLCPVYLRGFEVFAKGVPFVPAKLRYLARDFIRCAEHFQIPARFPTVFPINGLYALRGALVAMDEGKLDDYHERMFRATWAEDRNIARAEVVVEVASEAGLDPANFATAIAEQGVKDRLRQATDRAVQRGVFGAPTFFVGDEMFWGHDRLDYVRRAVGG